MRFIFTLLLLGYISTGVAQSIDDVTIDLDCTYWNEDFEVQSFDDLTPMDVNLLSELDNQLMQEDLYITNCFIFNERPKNRNMITLRFTNGLERVYIIKRQQPLQILNVFDYDDKLINLELNK
jgi:hypothetical protein